MAEKNGFNVDELQAMVAAVQQQPEAGKLTFRASYAWKDGFAGDTRLETIEQLGQQIPRRFTLPGDHPPELLGHDYGPSSVETLMAALASCVAGTYAAHAMARGVDIDSIDVEPQRVAAARPSPSRSVGYPRQGAREVRRGRCDAHRAVRGNEESLARLRRAHSPGAGGDLGRTRLIVWRDLSGWAAQRWRRIQTRSAVLVGSYKVGGDGSDSVLPGA